MKGDFSFIFELQNLKYLSPKSISGFNMVYIYDEVTTITSEFHSWMQKISNK